MNWFKKWWNLGKDPITNKRTPYKYEWTKFADEGDVLFKFNLINRKYNSFYNDKWNINHQVRVIDYINNFLVSAVFCCLCAWVVIDTIGGIGTYTWWHLRCYYSYIYDPSTKEITSFWRGTYQSLYNYEVVKDPLTNQYKVNIINNYGDWITWLQLSFEILIIILFSLCLFWQLHCAYDKRLRKEYQEIFSKRYDSIDVIRPMLNSSNPWKSASPYVLIFSIIVYISLSITYLVVSFEPPKFTVNVDANNSPVILMTSNKYEYDCYNNTFGEKNQDGEIVSAYIQNVFYTTTPLYKGTLWLLLFSFLISWGFSYGVGNKICYSSLKYALYLKFKDKSFLESLGFGKDEIQDINRIMKFSDKELSEEMDRFA